MKTLLSEFGILPEVFRASSYEHPDIVRLSLSQLRNFLMDDAVARDVAGVWINELVSGKMESITPYARELLESLMKSGRISVDDTAFKKGVVGDYSWSQLLTDSHQGRRFDLIIATKSLDFKNKGMPVTDVTNIDATEWWNSSRSIDLEVACSLNGYLNPLKKIARLSRRLIIIDPYLYPNSYSGNYKHFPELLGKLAAQNPYLFFEIHVKEMENEIVNVESFMPFLRMQKWKGELRLHVWKKLHDRFIISNLIGICMPKGLEIITKSEIPRIWTRMSQEMRILITERHDPIANKDNILKNFVKRGGK